MFALRQGWLNDKTFTFLLNGLGCLRNITEALRQPEQGVPNIKLNEFPNNFVSEFCYELISSMELQFQALYIWWWLTAAQKDQIQSVQICICRSGEWNDKYIKIYFMIFFINHWCSLRRKRRRKIQKSWANFCHRLCSERAEQRERRELKLSQFVPSQCFRGTCARRKEFCRTKRHLLCSANPFNSGLKWHYCVQGT